MYLAQRFEWKHGFPVIRPAKSTGHCQVIPLGLFGLQITAKKISDHRESNIFAGPLSALLTVNAIPLFPDDMALDIHKKRGRITFYSPDNDARIV